MMERKKQSRIYSTLLTGILLASLAAPSELSAQQEFYYDDPYCCPSSCSTFNWVTIAGAAVVGAAAGAATGYAAGHNRGNRGKRGKQGPEGPPGMGSGLEFNVTNPLIVTLEAGPLSPVLYTVDLRTETSGLVNLLGVDAIVSAGGVVVSLEPSVSKLVGDYYLVLEITSMLPDVAILGQFFLNDGVNLIPFTLVSGKDPAQSNLWEFGDVSVLVATFDP